MAGDGWASRGLAGRPWTAVGAPRHGGALSAAGRALGAAQAAAPALAGRLRRCRRRNRRRLARPRVIVRIGSHARPFARMARADGKGRQIGLHARVDPSIPSRDISELCEYPLPWLCGFALMGLQSPPLIWEWQSRGCRFWSTRWKPRSALLIGLYPSSPEGHG